ncbi:MAG: YraN family protein [Pseudomonadota bacterium]
MSQKRLEQVTKRQWAERKGRLFEMVAAGFYIASGYRLVDRRFKRRVGEIDLVCQRGNTLAFVEVKARRSADDAIAAVTAKNRRRFENATKVYLAENDRRIGGERHQPDVRFDIVAFGKGFTVKWIKDAWREGERP